MRLSVKLLGAFALLCAIALATAHSDEGHKARKGHKHVTPSFLGSHSARTRDELAAMEHLGHGTALHSAHIVDRIGATDAALSSYPASIGDLTDAVVSFKNIAAPNVTDYIIISCGPVHALSDYLDKRNAYANSSDPALKAGEGSVRFNSLLFMRCDYVFTYINVQGANQVALANLTVPLRDSVCTPRQGHLSLTENEDEMLVIYNSGCTKVLPSVKFGTSSNSYTDVVSGQSVTYNASDMCHLPATLTLQPWFRDPGFIHRVLLSELELGTTYYYRFGNDVDGWSHEYSFHTRPPLGSPTANFIAYADMGIDPQPSAIGVASWIPIEIQNGFDDFLLHFGDISYARGQAWIWERFFSMIEPYATRMPYMISVGNHEYDHTSGGENDPSKAPGNGFRPDWGNMGGDSEGECSVPMYYRFSAPNNGKDIYWYSFDYGPVHVIQFSSEHNWTRGSEQYNWIEQDLASVDRDLTPFVVITSHRMMYTTQLQEEDDYRVSQHMQQEMDDLINKYRVNLMLVGHQHSYERSCPVYNKQCVADGKAPVHIIVGTAGAGLEGGGFSPALGGWSVSQVEAWGYCRIAATRTDMHVEFVLSSSGEVYDEVTLYPY